jgi:predicted permease
VVVISHSLWESELGGAANVVGRSITVNDRPLTIIGVMPETFRGLSFDADIWYPTSLISLTMPPQVLERRGSRWLAAIGRLREGTTLEAAQRDLDGVAGRLAEQYPETNTDRGVRVMSLRENYLGDTESLLLSVLAAVLLLLLIAGANVAGLTLARNTARQREVSIRAALGARRGRLLRQLTTEGVLLALAAGALGTFVAAWSVDALIPFIPDGMLPAYVDVRIDARALGVSLALSLLTGLAVGLLPALRGTRIELAQSLKEGARSVESGLGRLRRPGVQQLLIIAEVALAIVLLAGAGLLMRSFAKQLAVPPGFRAENVLAARISLPAGRYTPEARAAFAERLVERLTSHPSVRSASVSSDLPFRGFTSAGFIWVDPAAADGIRYYRHSVTPDFFATLGIPMLRGRAFTPRDQRGTPPVVIVSEAMAKRFWPDTDPVGQRLWFAPEQYATIVGVAATARYRDLATVLTDAKSEPDVFFPFAQRTDRDIEIAVRSATGGLTPAEVLRKAVAAIDPSLPLYQVQPLADALRQQSASGRFGSLLFGVFSGAALLLSAVGLYGMIAFVVGLSRREIAVRLALGADAAGVLRLIVRNAMAPVLAGTVLGLAGAALSTRALERQLFGVTPTDPLTFAVVAVALLLVALAASWLPARQASRVDPHLVLKSE